MMIMTGIFRFVLLPHVKGKSFEEYMIDQVFTNPDVLQATRITRGFSHELLACRFRRPGRREFINPHPETQYVWQAKVKLQTDSGYNFEQNVDSIRDHVAQFALLIGVDSYSNVDA
jgi:hypothetical protein